MKKLLILAVGLFTLLAVSACNTATKEKLGISRKAPNEFMVSPRPPLSLPPEYDLRPVVEPLSTNDNKADLSASEQNLVSQMESNK